MKVKDLDDERVKSLMRTLESDVKEDIFKLILLLDAIQEGSGLNSHGCAIAFLSKGTGAGENTSVLASGTRQMKEWCTEASKGRFSSTGLQLVDTFEGNRTGVGASMPALVTGHVTEADALRTSARCVGSSDQEPGSRGEGVGRQGRGARGGRGGCTRGRT